MARKSPGVIPGALDTLVRNEVAHRRAKAILAPYERQDNRRSALQLAVTLALYGVAWTALLRSVEVGYWLTAIVALPAAGLFVRLIIIQHDCSHGSSAQSQLTQAVAQCKRFLCVLACGCCSRRRWAGCGRSWFGGRCRVRR